MKVSVTLSPGDRHDVEPEVLFSAGQEHPASELRHETLIAAGVRVSVDLTTPHRWRSFTVSSWNFPAQELIRDLIGATATERITAHLRAGADPAGRIGGAKIEGTRLEVDPSAAGPWLRVAVADALDRWLQLPLDQSLVDAERGVARIRAALTLPEGANRTEVLARSLIMTRRAAPGLATYIRRIRPQIRPVPPALRDGLRRLVHGYAALMAEVSGSDQDLGLVIEAWDDLCRFRPEHPPAVLRLPPHPLPLRNRNPSEVTAPAGLIDPRQVPARILMMDADPDQPEITVRPAGSSGLRNVRTVIVDVPVFGHFTAGHGAGSRILARLVDHGSGRAHGEALLTLHTGDRSGARKPTLRGVLRVPLGQDGVDLDTVRVDVFDALSERQPASSDADPTLQNARRAILALREWRHLVAEARLRTVAVRPVARVRRISRLLLPADEVGARIGVPAATGLGRGRYEQLSDLGDSALLDLLQNTRWPAPDENDDSSILAPALGTSDLLVAELAAAQDSPLGEDGC
jgi:hypothetical protein